MRSLLSLPAVLAFWTYTSAASILQQQPLNFESESKKPLPLLIWHGLGDQYDNDGLHTVGDLAKEVNRGTYVYYIRIDEDGGQDRQATFLGNLTEQISQVCQDIRNDTQLWQQNSHGDGVGESVHVDALGFSQGGQFLRGLIQRCEGLHVRSLVTYGSQHNGIAAIKACGTWDFLCKGALALMKGNAYSDYVQSRVVPAQYYRTINETDGEPVEGYLKYSNFLADVNNEREEKKKVYAERLARLEKFVMVVFADDTTVIPKESGWFAEVNATTEKVTPLRERKIYKEDWIGLKQLDKKGALEFESTKGDHMQLDDEGLAGTFEKYFGPEKHFGKVQVVKKPRPCSGRKKSWQSKMEAWRKGLDAPIKEYL
ncbi:Putative palmitoyl protein thioesterase [Septoria linicola]|uniref:Palmitoyl-protein thioesterase 1 n=1 Tax=Septoria linicola TaxID=215465 RepID=A0A9Q9AL37_9PEZI|nr:putative palmitoyl protein thioesterase [Septoria linicola]USW49974.1 Putative palmitoyl protein thioesterase [Septoria linicola]